MNPLFPKLFQTEAAVSFWAAQVCWVQRDGVHNGLLFRHLWHLLWVTCEPATLLVGARKRGSSGDGITTFFGLEMAKHADCQPVMMHDPLTLLWIHVWKTYYFEGSPKKYNEHQQKPGIPGLNMDPVGQFWWPKCHFLKKQFKIDCGQNLRSRAHVCLSGAFKPCGGSPKP